MNPLYMQVAEQDYEKEKLNERIAKLSGGVAIIQVSDVSNCFAGPELLLWNFLCYL
jgi:hypothetical protein